MKFSPQQPPVKLNTLQLVRLVAAEFRKSHGDKAADKPAGDPVRLNDADL